tara:strand:+ start:1059 stop:1448 length:390 start_codon:yes stop_codon:yes gene_type:complete
MLQIDDNNFSLFAAKYYDNPNCIDILEFHDDLNRIKYIKRLLKQYSESGKLKERLILNHLITLFNVFESPACTKMLVFKLYEHMPVLKSFISYLNYWPERIEGLGANNLIILSVEIESDPYVDKVLQSI